MTVSTIEPGAFVRLRHDPSRTGLLVDVREERGSLRAWVQFADGKRKLPADQIEAVPANLESSVDRLRDGHLEAPESLRRQLAHIKLSGRMSDMLYSLEATDTEFFAHQFKPVLKLLKSPTGHLLIADEVGLGKTIEAGLIWTELQARHRHRRLLVICPKILCEKWRLELSTKFDLDAKIMTPDELTEALSSPTSQRRGFVAICGMQSIRPRSESDRKERKSDELANFVESIEAFDHRIDMLVVDEAHHMRNPGTQTNALGQMMAKISTHVVMLSATPINLQNRDLHSLLQLVDADTFRDERALEGIIAANAPVIAARDSLLRGGSSEEVSELLGRAAQHELLAQTRSLRRMREELAAHPSNLSPSERSELAARIDSVNLLANVINRTRRRDVEEHRVIRQVFAMKAVMTQAEREVYENATEAILNFAEERGYPVGFLTVMPQRMLASCLPATVAHWAGSHGVDGIEDEDTEHAGSESTTPLRRELQRLTRELPAPDILERQDSKFQKLLDAIRSHRAERPGEKIIVFSTFRATLDYLSRRLGGEGMGNAILDGRVKERTKLIDRFRTDPELQILLSSEVGSEGIDLQFAQTVMNYDLPWNPMRVEQRIGRVDRLGQKAEKVTVLNLMHANTIDQRIWDKLYHRLGLCEQALGGFEDVLGSEIRALEKEILSGKLSSEEQERRIEQRALAIENVRRHEEELEREAAALIAHGDYVLREIRERRDDQRWISTEDIVDYLGLGLGRLHPDSRVTFEREAGKVAIKLDVDGRHEFNEWGRRHSVDPGPLARTTGTLAFRLGQDSGNERLPRISQSHPLLRYISDALTQSGQMGAAAVAMACKSEEVGLPLGVYAGAIQEWKFGSQEPELKIAWSLASIDGWSLLDSGDAEKAIRRALEKGRPWATAAEEAPLGSVADGLENVVVEDVERRFDHESERRETEVADRIAIQLASLDRGAAEDRARIERQMALSGPRLEAANRARLERLNGRVETRRRQLQSRADNAREARDVAVLLLLVEE